MADKQIQYNLDQALGVRESHRVTGTSAAYPLKGNGILCDITFNKSTTGGVWVFDMGAGTSTTAICGATTGTGGAITIVGSASITQPTYPRRLSVTSGGTAADINAGSVRITGTDNNGSPMEEYFNIAENTAATTNGTYRFASVDYIEIHPQDGTGATFSVGTREGSVIAYILSPSVGDKFTYNVGVIEGITIVSGSASDIVVTYIG